MRTLLAALIGERVDESAPLDERYVLAIQLRARNSAVSVARSTRQLVSRPHSWLLWPH